MGLFTPLSFPQTIKPDALSATLLSEKKVISNDLILQFLKKTDLVVGAPLDTLFKSYISVLENPDAPVEIGERNPAELTMYPGFFISKEKGITWLLYFLYLPGEEKCAGAPSVWLSLLGAFDESGQIKHGRILAEERYSSDAPVFAKQTSELNFTNPKTIRVSKTHAEGEFDENGYEKISSTKTEKETVQMLDGKSVVLPSRCTLPNQPKNK